MQIHVARSGRSAGNTVHGDDAKQRIARLPNIIKGNVTQPYLAAAQANALIIALIIVMHQGNVRMNRLARMAQMMTVLANAQRNASTVVPQTA